MINNPGQHIILDCSYCDQTTLLSEQLLTISTRCKQLLIDYGCTIVAYTEHQFEGGGYTFVYVLAESHFSVHTWPEHQYCAVDLFSCVHREDYKFNGLIHDIAVIFGTKDIKQQLIVRKYTSK